MLRGGGLLERLRPALNMAAVALRPGIDRLRRGRSPGGASVDERPNPWEAAYPDGITWEFGFEPRPLYTLLDETAARFGDRPCLEFLGKRYTFRKVAELVDRTAAGLRRLGVDRGVKVGLFMPNCPFYVIGYFAVLKAGGTVVNFNPLLAGPEIAAQIEQSGTRIMMTLDLAAAFEKVDRSLADTALETIVVCRMSRALRFPKSALFKITRRKELASIPRRSGSHVRFEDLLVNGPIAVPASCDPCRDIAVLQFTGGTTGTSKSAMLTHTALLANALQIARWCEGLGSDRERMIGVLPLFHVFGMTAIMNFSMLCGIEVILQPRYRTHDVVRAVVRHRATVLMGVPTMFSALVSDREAGRQDLSRLRYCISGGAPLPIETKRAFERMTGCALVEGYGLTEAGPIVTIGPLDGRDRPGSVGLPLPGTRVEIRALEKPDRRLPPGAPGEICVSGPQLMAGYCNNEAETTQVMRDGWLFTGDVGYLDEDGFLFVIDRIKDLIITGGFNVYPRVVEEALYRHPAVAEAAVVGVPDRHRGEVVKAFVRLRDGEAVSAAELRAFLKDQVAAYEVPRIVEICRELPKTLVGKPSRRELLARELKRSRGAIPKSRILDCEEEVAQ